MSKQVERWLPVPGYEGRHEVSDWGNVRTDSYHRKVRYVYSRNGYPYVRLGYQGDNKPALFSVARLVMEAFIGQRPTDMRILRKDGNPQNCHLDNLEYVTYAEVVAHAKELGNFVGRRPSVETARVEEIRQAILTGEMTYAEISAEYGVSQSLVSDIAKGKGRFGNYKPLPRRNQKITDADVIAIRDALAQGASMSALAEHYNVSLATISRIKGGTRRVKSTGGNGTVNGIPFTSVADDSD